MLIPHDVQTFWDSYKNQLQLLNKMRFNRFVLIPNPVEVQIHGFCDASEKAYGACLYFRAIDQEENHHCSLICSKSKVAPVGKNT